MTAMLLLLGYLDIYSQVHQKWFSVATSTFFVGLKASRVFRLCSLDRSL
jgi:hypothetical protein